MRKDWLKKNQVFWLISLVVALVAIISLRIENIGINPLESEIYLNNPVQVYTGNDYRFYITESAGQIAVTDEKNTLLYNIDGDDGELSFSYAADVVSDENNAVYVLDKLFADDGTTAYSERILKFSMEGEYEGVVYEIETLNEEGKQDIFLNGLMLIENKLYFSQIETDGIFVFGIDGDSVEETAFLSMENAGYTVADVAFNNEMEIAAAMKNGDVYVGKSNEKVCIYKAREYDKKEYFSMVSEIVYDEENNLYISDSGLREIYKFSQDKTSMENIVSRNEYSVMEINEFAVTPLYTGLNVRNGMVSFLSSEYLYDVENDEEIFYYNMVILSQDGNVEFFETIENSMKERVEVVVVYMAIILLIVIAIYSIVKLRWILQQVKTDESTKIQLVMIITALVITLGVSYVIFDNCNERFIKEAGDKLTNVAYLLAESIDKEYISSINSPEEYYTEEYKKLDEDVNYVLDSKVNKENYLYCVIYKVYNDVVCEVYRDDMLHGVMYPMAGRYANSIEEYIAEENDYDVCYEFALSEGTYMYALIPVYDEDGETIAFIETGMDYTTFSDANNELYVKVLMLAVMAVIIIMLLFTETLHTATAIRVRKESKKKNGICMPELIRPISFLFFMIANMSTAFLPIYGMNLWNDSFPMQAEMAAALPISAELIVAAITAFLCGFIVQKLGIKVICILGAGFYVLGNIMSAFAPNLWILISANAVCGIGSGFLTIALNSWAASYEEEALQNKGFIHINAAYLAGLNCGTVIGSLIWENFGVSMVYYVAAVGAVLIILLSLCMIGKIDVVPEEVDEGEGGGLKDLFTSSVLRFFICITIPYLVCTAFLEYFFPIEAEMSGLSATHISMAFLLSGLISIYIGSSMAEPITEKMGTKKAMILASFIYAIALMYLVANPTVWSCYVVVVLFAIADSFGLSAQSVYFSSLDEVKRVGQSKALGVNSTVEAATSACGSLIFGAALMLGTQKGIFIIGTVFAVLLIIFVIGDRKKGEL